jgi:hypothetical protein
MNFTTKKKRQAAQVYFSIPTYFKIKQIAAEEGKPLAAWLRDLANKEIERKEKERPKLKAPPTFKWNIDPHASEKVDDIYLT